MVSTVSSQQEGLGFKSRSACLTSRRSWIRYPAGVGPFCVEFACPPRGCVDFLWEPCPVIWRLTGDYIACRCDCGQLYDFALYIFILCYSMPSVRSSVSISLLLLTSVISDNDNKMMRLWLWLFVSICQLVQGEPRPHPLSAGIGSSSLRNPTKDKQLGTMNE